MWYSTCENWDPEQCQGHSILSCQCVWGCLANLTSPTSYCQQVVPCLWRMSQSLLSGCGDFCFPSHRRYDDLYCCNSIRSTPGVEDETHSFVTMKERKFWVLRISRRIWEKKFYQSFDYKFMENLWYQLYQIQSLPAWLYTIVLVWWSLVTVMDWQYKKYK